MYTHCPHCDTCFRVTTEQLKAARGSVRCGRCFGTFNALENLVDEPPQPDGQQQPPALTPATTSKPAPAPRPTPTAKAAKPEVAPPTASATKPSPTPQATPRTARPAAAQPAIATKPAPAPHAEPKTAKPAVPQRPAVAMAPKPTVAPQPAPMTRVASTEETTAEPAATPASSAPPSATPDLAREAQLERSQLLVEEIQSTAAKPARNLLWLWLTLSVLLTLLLTGQYAYFNVASLAQQPQLRPVLTVMCDIAKCEVPLIKAPYMITLVERDIRNHPERPDILMVKARIINKAPYAQAYPMMELSLHDITGHILAARRFDPSEYLADDVDQKQGMAPQEVVDIQLELADPGKEAVGFEFEFL